MDNMLGTMGPQIARKGGGGGGTTVQESGIPKEFRPFITKALGDAQGLYDSGDLSRVEGLSDEQESAFQRKTALGAEGGTLDQIAGDARTAAGTFGDAASGTGALFGGDALQQQTAALTAGGANNPIASAVQSAVGGAQTNQALGGSLGSARAGATTQKAGFDAATEVAGQELAARRGAALQGAQGAVGSAGSLQRAAGAGIAATEGVGAARQQQAQNEQDAAYQGIQRLFGLYGSPAVGTETKSTTSGGGK